MGEGGLTVPNVILDTLLKAEYPHITKIRLKEMQEKQVSSVWIVLIYCLGIEAISE
jgi:hypothetical protein